LLDPGGFFNTDIENTPSSGKRSKAKFVSNVIQTGYFIALNATPFCLQRPFNNFIATVTLYPLCVVQCELPPIGV